MSSSIQIDPDFFGVYRKVRVLSISKDFEVWLIEHRPTKKLYNFKVFSLSKENLKKIQNEVWILRGLEHSSIPKVYNAILFDESNIGIITEYKGGVTLQDILINLETTGKTISSQHLNKIKNKLLEIVRYIHSQHTYHNNINNNTILFTDSGLLLIGWQDSCMNYTFNKALNKTLKDFDCRSQNNELTDLESVERILDQFK